MCYSLGDFIEDLQKFKPDTLVSNICNPHSYRGDYYQLAFEPKEGKRKVSELLEECLDILGTELRGYKGGEFEMNVDVEVYIAYYGCCGERITNIGIII